MSDTAGTPTAASTAAHDEATLLRLPTELLLDILSGLSYAELHKAEQVCKKLQGLVADKHFDPILFRQKPSRKLKEGDKVELHPLLSRLYALDIRPAKATFWNGADVECNAFDYKAVDERATSPACDCIEVSVLIGEPGILSNRSGVTVRQILDAIGKMWTSKPPLWIRFDRAHWEEKHVDDVTWWDVMGDRNGWGGWSKVEVDAGGTAHLDTSGWDS